MATMIPRTSIDEANRHLTALHKRVGELEATVKEQNEALHAKDDWLKTRIADIETTKNNELAKLTEKITATEKTVDILQEQLRQKYQQVAVLQRSCRLMQNLVSLKSNVKEILLCMDEAEKDLISQKDFLSLYSESSSPVTNHTNSASKSSEMYENSLLVNSYANHVDSQDDPSTDGLESGDNVWKVRQERKSSREEKKTKVKGKEFYL